MINKQDSEQSQKYEHENRTIIDKIQDYTNTDCILSEQMRKSEKNIAQDLFEKRFDIFTKATINARNGPLQ